MEYAHPDRREVVGVSCLAVIPVARAYSAREEAYREECEYHSEPYILSCADVDIASE